MPQRFYVHRQTKSGDQHVYAARTRFIPSAILPLFELRTWPMAARPTTGKAPVRGEIQVDIAARMRGMWR